MIEPSFLGKKKEETMQNRQLSNLHFVKSLFKTFIHFTSKFHLSISPLVPQYGNSHNVL